MARVARSVQDERVQAGVMVNGVVVERGEGTPQGGPLSLLLANILLDDLDWSWRSAATGSYAMRAMLTFTYGAGEPGSREATEAEGEPAKERRGPGMESGVPGL